MKNNTGNIHISSESACLVHENGLNPVLLLLLLLLSIEPSAVNFSAEPEEEEVVEVDDIIGWEICLNKCGTESRQYVIEAAVLDPAEDEHPVRVAPCVQKVSFGESQGQMKTTNFAILTLEYWWFRRFV